MPSLFRSKHVEDPAETKPVEALATEPNEGEVGFRCKRIPCGWRMSCTFHGGGRCRNMCIRLSGVGGNRNKRVESWVGVGVCCGIEGVFRHCTSYAVVATVLLGAAVSRHLSATDPSVARRDALQGTVIRLREGFRLKDQNSSTQTILMQDLADELALVDAKAEKLRGEMLDLQHAAAFLPRTKIQASVDYSIKTK
nr:calpain-type cysteine protease DEK1 [Ipomoea batatas]